MTTPADAEQPDTEQSPPVEAPEQPVEHVQAHAGHAAGTGQAAP